MNREELQKLAESGDTEAQLKLGMNLLNRDENWLFKPGTKLPDENEYEQAIAWFEKAATAGNVNAQAALAFILDGTVVQRLKGGRINIKDKEKSLYWTHQAAQNGNKWAAGREAERYATEGENYDFEKAVYWYKRSEEYFNLAWFLDYNDKLEEALPYYKMAFENHDPQCKENIIAYMKNINELLKDADDWYEHGGNIVVHSTAPDEPSKRLIPIPKEEWCEDDREAFENALLEYKIALERFEIGIPTYFEWFQQDQLNGIRESIQEIEETLANFPDNGYSDEEESESPNE